MEDLKLHDYDEYLDDGNLIQEPQKLPQTLTPYALPSEENDDYNGLVSDEVGNGTRAQTVEEANLLYSRLMNVTPYSSRGGSNAIPSRNPNKKAKAKKRRIQKNSRKKNR